MNYKCTRCGIEKEASEFSSDKRRPQGLQSACKKCVNIYQRAYSKTKYRREYAAARRVKYLSSLTREEKDKINEYKRNRLKISEEAAKKRKLSLLKYNKSEHGKEVIKNREKERKKNDPQVKLRSTLRSRIRIALKEDKKTLSTEILIGCSIEYAKNHLEMQFKDGMTWENHGEWHIDHIIPLASFDLTIESERIIAFCYKNLQPLWAIDNLKKNKRILINEVHCEL